MNYKERYADSPLEELIHIIEHGSDYNEECVTTVKQIMLERDLSQEEISNAANKVNSERIEKQLISFNAFTDELELISSFFLSKGEMKECYKLVVEDMKSRRMDLEFDVWSYAIGGCVKSITFVLCKKPLYIKIGNFYLR